MRLRGRARRLTIFIGDTDQHRHRPLYSEIVHRARDRGMAGASVFHGIEGYGASSRVHTSRILSLSDDLPIAIVIVDTEDRIDGFLPELDGLIDEGLVIVDDVDVYRYAGRREASDPGEGTAADGSRGETP
jgi:PII-like signaling protein